MGPPGLIRPPWLGVVDEEAAATARAATRAVVMDRRDKIEHARFVGGPTPVGMNTGVVTARQTLGWPRSPASAHADRNARAGTRVS